MTTTDVAQWIVMTLENSTEERSIKMSEIQSRIPGNIGTIKVDTISKLLKRIFPKVTIVRIRDPKDWVKRLQICRGLQFKAQENATTITEVEFPDALPKSVVLLQTCMPSVAMPTDIVLDGEIVMKYISFDFNKLTWYMTIGKDDVKHLNGKFQMTKSSIQAVCNTVQCAPVCTGVPEKDVKMHVKKVFLRMTVFRTSEENSFSVAYVSKRCSKIVTWINGAPHICRKCVNDITKKEFVSDSVMKTNPTPNVPVTDTQPSGQMNMTSPQTSTPSNSTSIPKDSSTSNVFDNNVKLSPNDDEDMTQIFGSVFKDAPAKFLILLADQQRALCAKSKTGRRWSPEVISTCLSIYVRSPSQYQELLDSGMFVLPSRVQLKRYKSKSIARGRHK